MTPGKMAQSGLPNWARRCHFVLWKPSWPKCIFVICKCLFNTCFIRVFEGWTHYRPQTCRLRRPFNRDVVALICLQDNHKLVCCELRKWHDRWVYSFFFAYLSWAMESGVNDNHRGNTRNWQTKVGIIKRKAHGLWRGWGHLDKFNMFLQLT